MSPPGKAEQERSGSRTPAGWASHQGSLILRGGAERLAQTLGVGTKASPEKVAGAGLVGLDRERPVRRRFERPSHVGVASQTPPTSRHVYGLEQGFGDLCGGDAIGHDSRYTGLPRFGRLRAYAGRRERQVMTAHARWSMAR